MKILLAVDGSAHALAACRYLAAFPLPQPLQVEVLTVVNPPDVVLSAQSELWYPQFLEHQEEIARQAIASSRQAIENLTAEISSHQMMGHVGHSIVERAAEGKFDLVVVAAKGHSALERVLLGSVSDYVTHHARCSVLVVRQQVSESKSETDAERDAERDAETDAVQASTLREGMVAVDEREVSAAMIQHLCRYAWTQAHHLTAVTAAVKLEVFREDILTSTQEESARRRAVAKRCADAAAAQLATSGARASAHSIEVDHVGEGLVEYAQQSKSDLVVIGNTGRGLISRLLLGSTSRYVLHHVPCSVMVVRKETTS